MYQEEKDGLINIINQEIQWCKDNEGKSDKGKLFEEGFIEGLKQSQCCIEEFYKIQKQIEREENV
jgi:hypothetical protein